MAVIGIISQKGGSGKSALSVKALDVCSIGGREMPSLTVIEEIYLASVGQGLGCRPGPG